MSDKELVSFTVEMFGFQHGNFEGEEGFILKSVEFLPIDVEKILDEGEHQGRKSGRGRKYGSGWTLPSRIVGRVHTLIENAEVKSKEQAFRRVSEERKCEYETVKDIYYKALRRDEFRPSVIFHEPPLIILPEIRREEVNLESVISIIRDNVSKGKIWSPDNLKEKMKQIIQTYGYEKAREIESIYVEELEKLLTVETDNETILVAKKWLKESGIIEKQKSSMTQIG